VCLPRTFAGAQHKPQTEAGKNKQKIKTSEKDLAVNTGGGVTRQIIREGCKTIKTSLKKGPKPKRGMSEGPSKTPRTGTQGNSPGRLSQDGNPIFSSKKKKQRIRKCMGTVVWGHIRPRGWGTGEKVGSREGGGAVGVFDRQKTGGQLKVMGSNERGGRNPERQ